MNINKVSSMRMRDTVCDVVEQSYLWLIKLMSVFKTFNLVVQIEA